MESWVRKDFVKRMKKNDGKKEKQKDDGKEE